MKQPMKKGAEIRHAAFLLRQLDSIDEWLDTLKPLTAPKVMVDIDTTNEEEDEHQGYGDGNTYFDRAMFVDALKWLRQETIDRLKTYGVEP